MSSRPKLLFVVNDPRFFLSHRVRIAQQALARNYEVAVATAPGSKTEDIVEAGFIYRQILLSRSGTSPIEEIRTFFGLLTIFKDYRPDIVHLVTIKPVLYGGIAARLAGVPAVVSAISGLGFMFGDVRRLRRRIERYVVTLFYRLALGHPNQRVIIQNRDDESMLLLKAALRKDIIVRIPGSGVDLSEYKMTPEPNSDLTVVMASRLLREKGVYEFVAAARILKQTQERKVRFLLVGEPDLENPTSITSSEVDEWRSEGVVQCLGHRSDISSIFSSAHIIVLPSYYGEGVPKVLLEAAACGRAVVTTDMPGCREAIEAGRSGLLVAARDSGALADAIAKLLDDGELRCRMGQAGRKLALSKFSIDEVVEKHLSIYDELLCNSAIE